MVRLWQLLMAALAVGSISAVKLDPIFNSGPGTDAFAEHVIQTPDNKVLICGAFTKYNGVSAPYLARLNDDGSLDTNFHHGVNFWIRHMLLQPDGKIVVGGAFSQVEGSSRNLIARLNADGSLDPSFNPGSGFLDKVVPIDTNAPYVFWMALQPDGKILVTGSFARYNRRTVNAIVRINPDGSYDDTFHLGAGLNSWGRFVSVQANKQILLSGWFTSYDGALCNRLVRLNEDGTLDSSFLPYFGDKTAIYCAVPLPDGKMMVSGHSKSDFNLFKRGLARLNADGTEDSSFIGITNERTECVLPQADGKILASGWFTEAGGQARSCLARFNPDGTIDDTFPITAQFFVWNMVLDAQGRLLVVGGFPSIGGLQRMGVARLINLDKVEEPDPEPEPDPDPVTPPEPLTMRNPGFDYGSFRVTVKSEEAKKYCLEYCDRFGGTSWTALPEVSGTGGEITLSDQVPAWQRFYRVREIEP